MPVPGVWGPYYDAMLPGLWLNEGGQSAAGAALDHLLHLHRDSGPGVAEVAAHAATLAHFRAMADARWDLPRYDAEVRESQARRWVVYEALRNGSYFPWDYQPLRAASERYMRNHMDLNVLEENKRFPRGE